MKIIPPNPPRDIASEKAMTKEPLPQTGPSFGQMLDQAVELQTTTASASTKAMHINRPPIVSDQPRPTQQDSAAQVEASLAALDAYRGALADPGTNLREVAPLLNALEEMHQDLAKTLADLPTDDPLRRIGEETRTLIVAEKARFESGQYV